MSWTSTKSLKAAVVRYLEYAVRTSWTTQSSLEGLTSLASSTLLLGVGDSTPYSLPQVPQFSPPHLYQQKNYPHRRCYPTIPQYGRPPARLCSYGHARKTDYSKKQKRNKNAKSRKPWLPQRMAIDDRRLDEATRLKKQKRQQMPVSKGYL